MKLPVGDDRSAKRRCRRHSTEGVEKRKKEKEKKEADDRIGIVNHALEVVYESYVYVNPKNVVDWCTPCKSDNGRHQSSTTLRELHQRLD
jgi:hypothetical protein